jgi:hypothetical protein
MNLTEIIFVAVVIIIGLIIVVLLHKVEKLLEENKLSTEEIEKTSAGLQLVQKHLETSAGTFKVFVENQAEIINRMHQLREKQIILEDRIQRLGRE